MANRYPPGVSGDEEYFRGLTDDEEEDLLYKEVGISTTYFPTSVRKLHILVCDEEGQVMRHDAYYDWHENVLQIITRDLTGSVVDVKIGPRILRGPTG